MLICIDPGHGGKDPGTIGRSMTPEIYEKQIALSAGLILGGFLNHYGFDVCMTRSEDKYRWLVNRVRFANKRHADIFISVHVDGVESSLPHGFCSYYYPESTHGKMVADTIMERLRDQRYDLHGEGSKPKHERNFVLKYTRMTAILLELGFVSNSQDLKNLMDPIFLSDMIIEIAETIKHFPGR